jgi:hypothetical protein
MQDAASDFAFLRRIAGNERAYLDGALAYAVGLLAAGNASGAINALSSVPRRLADPYDVAELAYWRARALESRDLSAALQAYLEVLRSSAPSHFAYFARERLDSPEMSAKIARELTVREQQVATLLEEGNFEQAKRVQTDRILLSSNDREAQLRKLAGIYRELPRYREVLELTPEDLPRFPTVDTDDPDSLLMAMGLHDEAVGAITTRWGLRPARAALTRSHALNLASASRDSIYAIEVMMRSVPDDFHPDLLPLSVRRLLYPRYFYDVIVADAKRYDTDPRLVLSIMREESRFNPRAKSQAAARGLLQFIITTARDIGRAVGLVDLTPQDLYDPRIIIQLGAKYVSELGGKFEGDRYRVAAAAFFNSARRARSFSLCAVRRFFATAARAFSPLTLDMLTSERALYHSARTSNLRASSARSRSDHPLVHRTVHRHDLPFVEALDRNLARPSPHPRPKSIVREDLDRPLRHAIDVSHRQQVAGLSLDDDLGQSAGAGCDDRRLGGHRFQRSHTERLRLRGKEEEVARGEHLLEVRDIAEKMDLVAKMMRSCVGLGAGAIGPVAHHHETARHFRRNLLEDFDHIHYALDGTEVRDVTDELFILGSQQVAERSAVAPEPRGVDEVGNHLDRLAGRQICGRLEFQPLRYRRYAVRHVDAELRDRQIALVPPHQSDVGTVQRGDDLQIRTENLLGEMGADRMRNRVVDMENVELLVRRDLGHLRRQSQRIRRVRIEQRIGGHRHFMEVDSLVQTVQTRGESVADEVDFVAAARERHSELGGHDSRAAECRITGDSDSHHCAPI